MNNLEKYTGKWIWENVQKDEKYIELIRENDHLILKVTIKNKDTFQAEDLNLIFHDSEKSYFLTNHWLSKDGNKLFCLETQYKNSQEGIFINAQEFEFINENKLKQKVIGYNFNKEFEKWTPFEMESYLIRIE